MGNTNYDLVLMPQLKPNETATFAERAEGLLNSFHGVNAMGIVYLTNMYGYGAERSVNQIFHTWFRDGDPTYDDAKASRLGPAPGYVPGGPNSPVLRRAKTQIKIAAPRRACASNPRRRPTSTSTPVGIRCSEHEPCLGRLPSRYLLPGCPRSQLSKFVDQKAAERLACARGRARSSA